MVISRIFLCVTTRNTIIRALLPALNGGLSIQHAQALSSAQLPSLEPRRQINSTAVNFVAPYSKPKGKKGSKKDKWSDQEREKLLDSLNTAQKAWSKKFMPHAEKEKVAMHGPNSFLANQETATPQRPAQFVPGTPKEEETTVNGGGDTAKQIVQGSSVARNETVEQGTKNPYLPRIPKPVEDWSSSEAVQAMPLHGFYRLVLDDTSEFANPLPFGLRKQEQSPTLSSPGKDNSLTPPALSQPILPPKKAESAPSDHQPAVFPTIIRSQPKPTITFSSGLNSFAERRRDVALKNSKSEVIAGVRVPPKPAEPDNCSA